MKTYAIFLALLALCFAGLAPLAAQTSSDASGPITLSEPDLEQLVAPIALYPDPLIALILPASTVPSDIVLASRFLNNGGSADDIDSQSWDPNVKGLARYPDVLQMMDDNLDWTNQLGAAVVAQQADVMTAIQAMRAKAQQLGNLQTTPQQQVTTDDGAIQIVPADPQVIYVPYYDPTVVYVQAPPPAAPFITFSAGFAIGAWLAGDCDWHGHGIYYGGYYRPGYGWGRNNVTIINNYYWRPNPQRPPPRPPYRPGKPGGNLPGWRPPPNWGKPGGPGRPGGGKPPVTIQPVPGTRPGQPGNRPGGRPGQPSIQPVPGTRPTPGQPGTRPGGGKPGQPSIQPVPGTRPSKPSVPSTRPTPGAGRPTIQPTHPETKPAPRPQPTRPAPIATVDPTRATEALASGAVAAQHAVHPAASVRTNAPKHEASHATGAAEARSTSAAAGPPATRRPAARRRWRRTTRRTFHARTLIMVIKSLAHVCMKSNDLEKTEDFYCGVLGLKKIFDFTRHGSPIGFYMKTANETFIEVFLAGEVDKIDKQYLHHFCLETDALSELHHDLEDRGFEPGPIKMGSDKTQQFWIKDPNGLDVEFQEYTDQSAQRAGGTVEVNW